MIESQVANGHTIIRVTSQTLRDLLRHLADVELPSDEIHIESALIYWSTP